MPTGYRPGVANQELGFVLLNAATGLPLTGATVSAYRSVNGTGQSLVGGGVAEKGNGQYVLTMAAADIPGPESSFWFAAGGGVPVEKTVLTGAGVFLRNTSGQHVGFGLISRTDGSGITGASVTVYRSVDGGAQDVATGTVTELGLGQYDFSPSAADLGGDEITLLFTAAGTVAVEKTLLTVDATAGPQPGASGPGDDIQSALVAYLQTVPGVTGILGASPRTRFYPEFAPADATGIWCCYSLVQDDRPLTLGGRAGYGIARIRLDCWAVGSDQGHLRANALFLALWGALNGYRGLMGDVFVQRSNVENGQKASPPAPVAGKSKPEANANLEVVLVFNDL